MSMPWPPARAISSARRASSWPRTSARSGTVGVATARTVIGRGVRGGSRVRDRHAGHRHERAARPASAHRDRCLGQGGDRDDLDAVDEPSLIDGRRGHDDPADPLPRQRGHHRQDARDRAHLAAQAELADQRDRSTVRTDLLGTEEDAHGHRQIQGRTGLAQLRGCEIDGDPARRKHEPRVADRPADPFAGLLDRGVGQPDDREAGQPGGDVHLDPDEPPVEPMERGGRDDSQHGATLAALAHPALTGRSPAAHLNAR